MYQRVDIYKVYNEITARMYVRRIQRWDIKTE